MEIHYFLRLLLTENQGSDFQVLLQQFQISFATAVPESDFQVLLQQFLTFNATREGFHKCFKAEYCTRMCDTVSILFLDTNNSKHQHVRQIISLGLEGCVSVPKTKYIEGWISACHRYEDS